MKRQDERKQQLKEKVKKIRKAKKDLLSKLNPILNPCSSYEEYRCYKYLKSFSITFKKSEVYIEVPVEGDRVIKLIPTKVIEKLESVEEYKVFLTENLDHFMKKMGMYQTKISPLHKEIEEFLKVIEDLEVYILEYV